MAKSLILSFSFAAVLLFACKKTDVKTDSIPPAGVDSVPVKVKPDTSTLLKTTRIYNFDADGTTARDSTTGEWTYDDQRRVARLNFTGVGFSATTLYTYFNDRYTYTSNSYINGAFAMISNYVYYQHLSGRTDSTSSYSVGYNAQAGYESKIKTYYYYNMNNLDSIQKAYNLAGDTPVFWNSVGRYYTGSNLDSAIGMDNQGKITFIQYYSGGDPTASYSFNNGVLASIMTMSYLDSSTGGLHYYLGSNKLLSEYSSVTIPATNTFTESDTYQFDEASRVVVIMRDHHGMSPSQKEIFTYY